MWNSGKRSLATVMMTRMPKLIVATLCWLQLQLFAWPSSCKADWHPFVVCQISGAVSSFGIRKIKVVSEEARPSVSSGNNFKVTYGGPRDIVTVPSWKLWARMEAVFIGTGPLEDGKKWKHFSIQCSPISTTALIFGGSHALFVLLVRASCRWKWLCSTCGMIMTGVNSGTHRETCLSAILVTTNLM